MLAHQLCRSGELTLLQYFSKKVPTFDINFVDTQGQNCLHYAVGRGRHEFARHVLGHKAIDVNQKTTETGETPLFFALGKLKDRPSEKVRMVKLLLEDDRVDVGALNHDKKACYEVRQILITLAFRSTMTSLALMRQQLWWKRSI